ncbi:MAG: signal peptidase I [Candidatus Izemoplasmatales bacterium]
MLVGISAFFLLSIFNFLIDFYKVSSSSMEDVIYKNDFILLKKIFWQIEKNDIVVFKFPYKIKNKNINKRIVKKCIGLPGDTLYIISYKNGDDKVLIKDDLFKIKLYRNNINILYNSDLVRLTNKYMIFENGQEYFFLLTENDYCKLTSFSGIKCIEKVDVFASEYSKKFFFDTIIIPNKGDKIKITRYNLSKYVRLIESIEKNTIRIENDIIFINNKPSDYYLFKKNYYFVIGVNKLQSFDSLDWGLLPEDNIYGIVFAIFSTKNK